MNKPLVSIIIPCFNAEKYLMACLQSLFDQTYPNCEIIVIDDGSNDGSLKILEGLSDQIRYETGPNQGACPARNRGLELATGEFIKLCDADDTMPPNAIANQVEAMQKLGSGEIIYGIVQDMDTHEAVFKKVQTTSATPQDELISACFSEDILIGCPLHRRQFLIDHGIRFDETLLQGQEWNFHLAIACAGGTFIFHPEVVYYYRNHDAPDRISQRLKDKTTNVKESWLAQASGCRMIIAHYQDQTMPKPLKTHLRRRLRKAEARLTTRKMIDHAKSAHQLRLELDPAWRIRISDIRFFPRRYFSRKK